MATETADGASSVRWKPATMRLEMSMARVSHGRPSGWRERLAVDLVVDDRVDAGVIDLDDLEGMVGAVLGDDRLEAIARRPIAVPLPPPKLAPKVSTELGTNYRDCGTVLRIKGGAGSSQALDFGSTDCGILTICTQNRPQRRLGRRRWTFPESLPRFTHDNGASRE